ncbi:RICIN domain-containing protein [Streptomyces lutosisoli]
MGSRWKSARNGLCAGVEDGSAAAGKAVCRQTCDGGASRVWKLGAVDDASWTLEVVAGAAAVRARIRARSSNLPTGQRWRA